MKRLVALGSVLCVKTLAVALTVSDIYSDHMVLQRGREIPVWGKATPGENVRVRFAGCERTAQADAKGAWEVRLPAMAMRAEPGVLQVDGARDVRRFQDVLVGDVWLVSGQSNAEMNFGDGVTGGNADKARAKDYPCVRAVKFLHERALLPDATVVCGGWVVAEAATLDGITAEGYYMARELNARTGVPIGILDNNWGGCRLEPYLPLEAMSGVPGLESMHAKAKEQASRLASGYWKKKAFAAQDAFIAWAKRIERRKAAGEEVLNVPAVWHPFNTDYCGQYNAMIHPITRFPIAGATWYQGCSNANDGESYLPKLQALAASWRKAWGYEFPFYIVQLASFMEPTNDPAGGNGYAPIRNAQRKGAMTIPRSGLAVTIDIGNAKDIHPKNKRDVGYRLALWARRDVYGEKGLVVSGPVYRDMRAEGNRLVLRFDSTGDGLVAGRRNPDEPGARPVPDPDGRLDGFAVAGADRKWVWADAKIEGNDVVVSAKGVPNPVAVRYAYRANPMGGRLLYNSEGLPASPFRSDDW